MWDWWPIDSSGWGTGEWVLFFVALFVVCLVFSVWVFR